MEETFIKKIKGGIMGMKTGTKKPTDVEPWLNKLKEVNKPMYEELLNDYKAALELIKD
jgi:hypothetical protein